MSSKSVYLFTLSESLDQELELALATNLALVLSVVSVVLMTVVVSMVFSSVVLMSMVVSMMLVAMVMLLVVVHMMAMMMLVSSLVMMALGMMMTMMMLLMVVAVVVFGVVVMTMMTSMMRMVSVALHMVVVTLMMVSLVVVMVMMFGMVMLLVMVMMMVGHVVVMVAVNFANSAVDSLLGSLDQDLSIFILDFQSRNLDGFDLCVDLLDLRTTAAAAVHLMDAGDSRSLGEELDLLLEFAGSLLLALVVVELDHQLAAMVAVGVLDPAFQSVDLLLILPNQDGDLVGFLADFQATGLQQLFLVLHQSGHDRSLLVACG